MKLKKQLFCVIYRTGGTSNFKWNRSLAMTRDEAITKTQVLQKMGYKAFSEDYNLSLSLGLPETYDF